MSSAFSCATAKQAPWHASTDTNARRSSSLLPVVSTRLDHKQGCCTAADAEDARRVADRLDIPFYALDFHEEFGRIIDYFVEEYTAARTPNPCVMCNNWLKFGKLFDFADSVGAEYRGDGALCEGSGSSPGPSPCQARTIHDLGPRTGTWDLPDLCEA